MLWCAMIDQSVAVTVGRRATQGPAGQHEELAMHPNLSRRTLLGGAVGGSLAAALGSTARAQEATPSAPASATPVGGASAGPITIFEAKQIVTLNPIVPEATHVAVRDGRILGAGTLDDLTGWGDYTLDQTFADQVLVPGFIEGHSHPTEGLIAYLPYVGYFDRPGIDGEPLKGVTSYDALVAALKDADAKLADPNEPLVAMGFDPIYFWGEEPFSKATLDQVSTTRQIAVWYASLHVLMLNSAALAANKITASTTQSGVVMGADGEPTGQLNESPAMELATTIFEPILGLMGGAKTWEAFGTFARNAGCTTITDMASTMLADPASRQVVVDTVGAASFPARVAIYVDPTIGEGVDPDDVVSTVLALRETNGTDKLHFPGIKLVLDGSIQSFTAFMDWPGYYLGPNTQQELLLSPEDTLNWITPLQAAGIQASVHCNGDQTVEIFLDAVAEAARHTSAPGIRHVCQHSQLTTPAQYARMAELGVSANIFANHLWYWGDQHYEITVGPERAEGMDDPMSAAEHGVVYSFHTDAAVTPLGCLHSMWCAVNRVTPKGRVLGESRRISAEDALRAVTLGSAFLLGLDGELGSIETGKWADFTVLAENPLTVDPTHIRDIAVWGTVLGGVKQPGAGAAG